jgi:hypothetical protein
MLLAKLEKPIAIPSMVQELEQQVRDTGVEPRHRIKQLIGDTY